MPQVAATKPWLRVTDVADHLDLSIQRIYQMIRQNEFPWKYRRAGRAIFVDAADFFGGSNNRVDGRGREQEEVLANAA